MTATKPARPRRYESPAGLVVHLNANGSLRRMEHGDIVLNLFPGTEMEGGPANVYLRQLGANVAWTPLLGPCSPLTPRLDAAGLRATGDNMLEASLQLGRLRVTAQLSSAGLLSWDQKRYVLQTLRPATNGQTYTSLDKVPVTGTLPPAVKVPINADGVQALTLVVTPEGYLPPHFAVSNGVPVRLIFRQLGDVGCGDELIFTWGKEQSADLKLDSAGDTQELSFTPNQTGDFPFHCPHYFYQGVLTVHD